MYHINNNWKHRIDAIGDELLKKLDCSLFRLFEVESLLDLEDRLTRLDLYIGNGRHQF